MKTLSKLFLALALSAALAAPLLGAEEKKKKAEEAKARQFYGVLSCAKCTLKEADGCQAALTREVTNKEGKIAKMTTLLAKNEAANDFHGQICSPGTKLSITVTGTVSGQGKDKVISATKIQKAKSEFHGTLACAKCTLKMKEAEGCQAALTFQGKDRDGKAKETTVSLIQNQAAKDFHSHICAPGTKLKVAVKGYLSGQGNRKELVASSIAK